MRWFIALVIVMGVTSSGTKASTDAEFCSLLERLQPQFNRDIGRQVDEITVNRGLFVLCGARTVIFRKSLTVRSSDLRPGWQERFRLRWNGEMCIEAAWIDKIRTGWTVSMAALFADGTRFETSANCN